ncbi:MAG: hypothetical protein EXQ59_04930 [Acidobacteria bacterium]|nr:hypothetical protein [Acidobacteriota bacterium]
MTNTAARARAALAGLAVLTAVAASACGSGGDGSAGGGGLFRQYEYEEEVYLSLEGTATVYVHASLAALNALRGTSFTTAPDAPLDREAVRALFSTPVTRVSGRINTSRRSNRRFIHVKLDVDDIRRLGEAAPFAWSTYEFKRDGDLYVYRQAIGPAAGKDAGDVGLKGLEIVAFRLHLPSRIRYHNSGRDIGRGNILAWEQPLADRLRGSALALDARMDPESILYGTLWLFGWTFVAVAITFVLVIWWVRRRAPAERMA